MERPNQVWCADITYLPMRRGFLYLVAIMDWFTRTVLAWRISNTLEADFCIEALNEAIHRFGPPEIMNTDQGSQFTGLAWTDRLRRVGTRISMDGKGRCLDNIFIERLWRSLKYECVYLHAWKTGTQAKAGVGQWIAFYNHQRPHAAHGGQPPAVVYFNRIETDQQRRRVAKSPRKLSKDRGAAQFLFPACSCALRFLKLPDRAVGERVGSAEIVHVKHRLDALQAVPGDGGDFRRRTETDRFLKGRERYRAGDRFIWI